MAHLTGELERHRQLTWKANITMNTDAALDEFSSTWAVLCVMASHMTSSFKISSRSPSAASTVLLTKLTHLNGVSVITVTCGPLALS